MRQSMPDAPEGATTPTLADGLREVATWLDEHPEVRPAHAYVAISASEREDLEQLAEALGDRAREREGYGSQIEIEGRFANEHEGYGGVRVAAGLPLLKLAGEPVKPKYRPILPTGGES